MLKILEKIFSNVTIIIVSFLVIYATLPILSPIAFKLGYYKVGKGIQFTYRAFCHQAVERSLYLFADGNEEKNLEPAIAQFYNVEDLKRYGVIPETSYPENVSWSFKFLGYPYWGNEEVGYKVAYCIRDTGLYTGIAISSVVTYVILQRKKREGENIQEVKVPAWIYAVLMLPMALDGGFQTLAEYAKFTFVPQAYVDNIPKRIITGVLFGMGFGIFIVINLQKSAEVVYNTSNETK